MNLKKCTNEIRLHIKKRTLKKLGQKRRIQIYTKTNGKRNNEENKALQLSRKEGR